MEANKGETKMNENLNYTSHITATMSENSDNASENMILNAPLLSAENEIGDSDGEERVSRLDTPSNECEGTPASQCVVTTEDDNKAVLLKESEKAPPRKPEQKHKRIAVLESDSDEESVSSLQLREFDDDVSDKQTLNTAFGKKKPRALLDSDSDDDSTQFRGTVDVNDKETSSDETAKNISKFNSIIDSDSNDDAEQSNNIKLSAKKVTKKRSKFKSLIDSDSEEENTENENGLNVRSRSYIDTDASEDEDLITPHNKSFNEELETRKSKEQIIYTTNTKGELIPESADPQRKSRLSALCDSSSEDERPVDHESFEPMVEDHLHTIKPLPYKKTKSKTPKEPKPKKMTAKDAAKQRQEIRSESLRMLRESNISLPYHKPKSHTLQEFLQKRSRFASTLPSLSKSSPAVAIKMSKQQLELVSKVLKEKEQQVKEFFKSESESEGEDIDNNVDNVADEVEHNSGEVNIATGTSDACVKENTDKNEEEMAMDTCGDVESINTSEPLTVHDEKQGEKVVILENVLLNTNNDNFNTDTNVVEKCQSNDDQNQAAIHTDTFSEANHSLHQETSNTYADSENTELYTNEMNIVNNDMDVDTQETTNEPVIEPVEENHQVSEQNQVEGIENFNIGSDLQKSQVNDMSTSNDGNLSSKSTAKIDSHSLDEPMDTSFEVPPTDVPQVIEKKLDDVSPNLLPNTKDYDFNLDDLDEEPNEIKGTENDSDIVEKAIDPQKDSHVDGSKYDLDIFEDRPKTSENSLSADDRDDKLPEGAANHDTHAVIKKLSRMELLKQKLANTQPRLTGSPNEVIDLDKGVTRPNEVSKLIERFIKHTSRKTGPKQVHLSIVSVTGGEIHKETVDMNVDQESEPVAIMEVPGAKLQKLRDELQVQMARKRSEMWQKKKSQLQPESTKEGFEDEAKNDDADDEILDDEEEAELTDPSSEEEVEDEEEEVDESALVDEPRKKSAFVDDEAEESEREDEENVDEIVNEDDGATADVEDDDEDEEEDTNNENESDTEETTQNRTLKRIIKPVDDSDDESSRDSVQSSLVSEQQLAKQNNTDHATESCDDDDMLPPHQNPQLKTPHKTLEEKSDLGFFLTPVSYLTGLQSLNTGSKLPRDSPTISPFRMPNIPSPLREKHWQTGFGKQLFGETSEESSSQVSCDEASEETSQSQPNTQEPSTQDLLAVCSGTFSGATQTSRDTQDASNSFNSIDKQNEDYVPETCPTTQDLLGVCSGTFTGITQAENNLQKDAITDDSEKQNGTQAVTTQDMLAVCSGDFTGLEKPQASTSHEKQNSTQAVTTQDMLAVCSGDFTGLEKPQASTSRYPNSSFIQMDQVEEEKQLGEDQDLIISQLIDEDEMEQFKKKFISPPAAVRVRKAKVNLDGEEVRGSGAVIDSDDENEELGVMKKKKQQKKLTFSDDEESSDEEVNENEEEIELCDGEDEDIEENDQPVDDNVGYDSEENEIDLKENVQKAYKASDFFEKEAELSESDWDSADEDEKDLDDMEFEVADNEKFDEEQVKSDLEKIHMRRILDDDTREVKLLQELLLEDGELHGTGRQRQFRWKNIDSIGDENEENKDGELDVYFDEEESEEQWRKVRHQREMFLKEKRESQTLIEEEDIVLNDSQTLTFGKKAVVKCQSKSSSQIMSQIEKTKAKPGSPEAKQPFTLLNKRGSFLARNEQVLQRLAEITKVETVQQNGAVKNSKNFLFQTFSVEEKVTMIEDKKRKATSSDGTPNVIKKLRISSLTPSGDKKKFGKPDRAKQLFGRSQ